MVNLFLALKKENGVSERIRQIREELNTAEIRIEEKINTVEELRSLLQANGEKWQYLLSSQRSLVAVNQTLKDDDCLLNDGDEVIIPAPYWVSYPDMAILAGGKPVIIETSIEQHLKITPQQLEAAIC